jgi:hypothetical protein
MTEMPVVMVEKHMAKRNKEPQKFRAYCPECGTELLLMMHVPKRFRDMDVEVGERLPEPYMFFCVRCGYERYAPGSPKHPPPTGHITRHPVKLTAAPVTFRKRVYLTLTRPFSQSQLCLYNPVFLAELRALRRYRNRR